VRKEPLLNSSGDLPLNWILPLHCVRLRHGIRGLGVSLLLTSWAPSIGCLVDSGGLFNSTGASRYAARHCSYSQVPGIGRDWLDLQSIALEIALCVVEDLTRSLYFSKGRVCITRHNRSVINEVQQPTGVFCQDDLLLSTLYGGGEVLVVCLFELLAGLAFVSKFQEE
jgi:hypothetical protein